MKKVLLFVVPLFFLGVFLVGFWYVQSATSSKGALQVTAHPESDIYIDGKLIGKTPLCKCQPKDMIQVGEYTIRLVPKDEKKAVFEDKIPITKGTLTVVDRTFQEGALSEGSVITLTPLDNKKSLELLVLSLPQKADIYIDNNPSSASPFLLRNITESDHEIKLSKAGYKDKSVRIRTVPGYKLTAKVYLGVNPQAVIGSQDNASTITVSPTPTVPRVVILQTPTGFLRVRSGASLASSEIARVSPGDVFDLAIEQEGWYQIRLKDEAVGWISSQYAQKQ